MQFLTSMKNNLKTLKTALKTLTVFCELKSDEVISAFSRCLEAIDSENAEASVEAYCQFVSAFYKTGFESLGKYIEYVVCNNENIYVKTVGQGKTPHVKIWESVKNELSVLQTVADTASNSLTSQINWSGFLPEYVSGGADILPGFVHRSKNIQKYGYGQYAKNRMFFIDNENRIVPVKNPDETALSSLIGYEAERKIILDNSRALLNGKPAANILLTGDAGTGKSSSVKAVANSLADQGLRIIEIRKDQLSIIPSILDELSQNPLKFILFIDDISFKKDDDNFNALKAVLEGSVSAKSKNVIIYATSNRRHIVNERFSEREGDEIHRNDTIQEMVSLSERFGIHVLFQKPNKENFLNIVSKLAAKSGINIEEKELFLLAERYALERGGRSPRLAKQFVENLVSAK